MYAITSFASHPGQMKRLRAIAQARCQTMSGLIRFMISEFLAKEERRARQAAKEAARE